MENENQNASQTDVANGQNINQQQPVYQQQPQQQYQQPVNQQQYQQNQYQQPMYQQQYQQPMYQQQYQQPIYQQQPPYVKSSSVDISAIVNKKLEKFKADANKLFKKELKLSELLKGNKAVVGAVVIGVLIVILFLFSAVTHNGRMSERYYNKALIAFNNEEYDTALKHITSSLSYNAGNEKAAELKAEAEEKQKEEKIAEYMEEIARYEEKEDYSNAKFYAEKLADIDPQNQEYMDMVAKYEALYNEKQVELLKQEIENYKGSQDYETAYNYSVKLLNMESDNQEYSALVDELKPLRDNQIINSFSENIAKAKNDNDYYQAYQYAAQLASQFPDNQNFAAQAENLKAAYEADKAEKERIASEEAAAKAAEAEAAKAAEAERAAAEKAAKEETDAINSAISSENIEKLSELYSAASSDNKNYIKEQCEAKIMSYAKSNKSSVGTASVATLRTMYDKINKYSGVGFKFSQNINQLLNTISELINAQTSIDAGSASYSGPIKNIDNVIYTTIYVESRISNGNHISIAGYDITDAYLDEYLFSCDAISGGEGVLVYSGNINQQFYEGYFMYIGKGDYVDSAGFKHSYPKYEVIDESDIKAYNEYLDAAASVNSAKERKNSLVNQYNSIVE